jgi:hypothetical protein
MRAEAPSVRFCDAPGVATPADEEHRDGVNAGIAKAKYHELD